MFAVSHKRRYCPDFCCYQLSDTGMGGRLWNPGYVDDPLTLDLSDQRTRCQKKGSLKRYLGSDEGFPQYPNKNSYSLIGNTVNWRYCMGIKWEFTNQLVLNLESTNGVKCTTMTLPFLPLIEKSGLLLAKSTRKILRVSVASPGRSNPSQSRAREQLHLAAWQLQHPIFYPCG